MNFDTRSISFQTWARQHKILFWISICLMTMPVDALAVEEVGTEILSTCLSERRARAGDPTASVRYGLCLGYLKGIADTLNGTHFCLPETNETVVITQRLKQIYIEYALNHRDTLKLPARQTIIPAFRNEFPCN